MAKPMLAGRMTQKIAFEMREEVNPDHPHDEGNTRAEWIEQGCTAAELIPLRGGETVLAGRLQGTQTVILRLRSTSLTRRISSGWRARDIKAGTIYNIREITPDPVSRASIDILCQAGVAT